MAVRNLSQSTLANGRKSYRNTSTDFRGWGIASGGTELTFGGYKYHTFTASGTLTVSKQGRFEYLAIAGGGGGSASGGDGGGAGGVLSGVAVFDSGSLAIVVGAGGAGGFGRPTFTSYPIDRGHYGYPSLIGDSIVAVGGGGGNGSVDGGSGGGNNGVAIPTQGNNGGASAGGGAGAAAGATTAGGVGTAEFSEWGNAVGIGQLSGGVRYFAGGGAGQSGTGGLGGGGNSPASSAGGAAGTPNTGGGGGAGGWSSENFVSSGGAGGSGLVIVRYPA